MSNRIGQDSLNGHAAEKTPAAGPAAGNISDPVVALAERLADLDRLWLEVDRERDRLPGALPRRHFERAETIAKDGYFRLRARIAQTPATSLDGIVVKVRLLAEGSCEGPCGDESALAASVLRDLRRLAHSG